MGLCNHTWAKLASSHALLHSFSSRTANNLSRTTGVLSLIPSSPQYPLLEFARSHRRYDPFSLASLSPSSISHTFPNRERLLDSSDFHLWDPAVDRGELDSFFGKKGETWTVVLLGWMGAEHKHLRRYAEIYNSRGIRSVRFVVPMRELLGFDLFTAFEDRIDEFTRDLVSWCSAESAAENRLLLFHTFSNAGWLIYGAILKNLQSRSDIIEKIKGCVIDSGAEPEISPQVWARGCCAALFKNSTSSAQQSTEASEGGKPNGIKEKPAAEIVAFLLLEKFFTVVLMLPNLTQRLSRFISILRKSQPPCPQLYLYSSADTVISVRSVECFIEEQKALGRNVGAHDFGYSQHVNHFRRFPNIYRAKIDDFLKECSSPTSAHEA